MRSIQEIKDLVANEHGYYGWEDALTCPPEVVNRLTDIAMSNYTDEAITAQLQVAAQFAKVEKFREEEDAYVVEKILRSHESRGYHYEVHERSITDCPRIKLI